MRRGPQDAPRRVEMQFFRAPIPITPGRNFRSAAPASRWFRVRRGPQDDPRRPKMRFYRAQRTPSKLDLKKSLLGVQAPPRPRQDGSQVGGQNIQFWTPKLASIWGGGWSPRAPQSFFFGGPSCPPLVAPLLKEDLAARKGIITKITTFLEGGGFGGATCAPKKMLCGTLKLQAPPRDEC